MTETITIPEDITCTLEGTQLHCTKGAGKLTKQLAEPSIIMQHDAKNITLSCKKGNKHQFKILKSYAAHIRNMIRGLNKEYEYVLEACNVHFPMTLKVDKDKLMIANFLGEKEPRIAKIVPGVKVEIKGQRITITSSNKDAAGQTVSYIERATKIRNRDRRVFQDGIFLVERPGREQA